MGEFGPGFGGGAALQPSVVSPDPLAPITRAVMLQMPIWDSTDLPSTFWHLQLEVANAADTAFIVPLFQGDTTSARFNWFYKSEMSDTNHTLMRYPTKGVETFKAKTDSSGLAATAYFLLEDDAAAELASGYTYLQRSRQSNDGGQTWSLWNFEVIKI